MRTVARSDLGRYAAANARVRALLPGLLGRSGLEALYTYPNARAVSDVLARTAYGAESGDGGEPDPRRRLVTASRAVLKLLPPVERLFLRLYLQRHEVENLKILIRGLSGRLRGSDVRPHLLPLPEIESLDLDMLAEARSLDELVRRAGGSPYGAVLADAARRVADSGPFALEAALDRDYYERLWSAADTLSRADAARARAALGVLYDILNLGWTARYRFVLALPPAEVLQYTLDRGRRLTAETRRALCENPDWETVLRQTPYGAAFAGIAPQHFDSAAATLWRLLAAEARRLLRGYPFHVGVPLAFLLTQEIEIRDIEVLHEAKSLGMGAEEALARTATLRP